VSVYGDSLTPIVDYQAQGALSGYRVVRHTAGGSHLCGQGDHPATGRDRHWVQILDDVASGVDAVVIQYQGWQNYTLECGGAADAYPWAVWRDVDPGKRWRVHLDQIRLAVEAAGGRTHVFLVRSIPTPADLPSWAIPQRIIDAGIATMATRHPEVFTAVSARSLFSLAGGWTGMAPCLHQEVAAGLCGPRGAPDQPEGWVRLRHRDRIHLACPGSTAMVCSRESPAGRRYRLALFSALNAHFDRPTDRVADRATLSPVAGGAAPAGSR